MLTLILKDWIGLDRLSFLRCYIYPWYLKLYKKGKVVHIDH